MEQGELPENLYDFLYVDTGKINSLSAQIFSGLQESIRRIESTTKETSKKMSGTVPPNLLSGEMGGSKGTSFSTDTVSSPHDLIAIDALHRLKENGWIRDDLADAEVGEAIMLPVTISLFDATNLYEFMDHTPKELFVEGAANKTQRRAQQKEMETAKKMIAAINSMIPLGLQMKYRTEDDDQLWSTLKKEFLRETPASLTLKHGFFPQGLWYLCGILDAVPSPGLQQWPQWNAMIGGFSELSNQLQKTLGRGDDEYGITTVAIFRELHKAAAS